MEQLNCPMCGSKNIKIFKKFKANYETANCMVCGYSSKPPQIREKGDERKKRLKKRRKKLNSY